MARGRITDILYLAVMPILPRDGLRGGFNNYSNLTKSAQQREKSKWVSKVNSRSKSVGERNFNSIVNSFSRGEGARPGRSLVFIGDMWNGLLLPEFG
jgi:hypothetical protein